MTDKKCIIVYGCPPTPEDLNYDKHWIPWVKKQLISNGIETEIPHMPEPWQPEYEKFKKEFEKYEVTENTILIGHSCGTAFLIRWLGETKQKILKLILVAPWKINHRGDKFRDAFYNFPIDETIKDRVKEIVMFTSDNEKDAGKESAKIYHQAFDGQIIELKGKGHFTLKDMGTEEFPELIEVVLKD